MPLARTRGRAWVLVALLLALGTALVAAGCGGGDGSQSGSSAGAAADYVPATAPMYFEVSTDTAGAQWTQLIALAKNFPAYPDIEKQVREGLSSGNVDFERDVRPLLGGKAALAILQVPDVQQAVDQLPVPGATTSAAPSRAAEEQHVLVVVEIATGKRAEVEALITRGADSAKKTGTRDGASLYTDGDDMFAAVTDDALLIASTQGDLNAALDAKKGGSGQQLAGSDRFKSALGALPDGPFVQGFVDIAAFTKAVLAGTPQLAQLGGQLPQTGAMAMSLAAEENGVRMKAVIIDAPEAAQQGTFTPELVKQAPQDSLVYVGFANLAGTVQQSIGQVQGASPEVQRQLQAFATQLDQLIGVNLDELKALTSGEHAVVVTKGSPVPTVALVLEVEDGAKAKATLDKLAVSVPRALTQFGQAADLPAWKNVTVGGVTMRQLPLSPQAGVVYGVKGNTVVIGTLPDGVAEILEPTTTLDQDAAFKAASAGIAGQDVAGLFWLNIEEGLPLLEAAGAFEGADGQQALDNLRPVKNVVAWSTGGSEPTFEAFVTITK
ncbi:MAG: DUF3352 domain-containing protein [Thermoleophilia bacterium]|nr:DUF3352 domain-containing protein [Thermoleophilia bacterium]